jgi:hypothetical protein
MRADPKSEGGWRMADGERALVLLSFYQRSSAFIGGEKWNNKQFLIFAPIYLLLSTANRAV